MSAIAWDDAIGRAVVVKENEGKCLILTYYMPVPLEGTIACCQTHPSAHSCHQISTISIVLHASQNERGIPGKLLI